jgi:hypothetical protein
MWQHATPHWKKRRSLCACRGDCGSDVEDEEVARRERGQRVFCRGGAFGRQGWWMRVKPTQHPPRRPSRCRDRNGDCESEQEAQLQGSRARGGSQARIHQARLAKLGTWMFFSSHRAASPLHHRTSSRRLQQPGKPPEAPAQAHRCQVPLLLVDDAAAAGTPVSLLAISQPLSREASSRRAGGTQCPKCQLRASSRASETLVAAPKWRMSL